ncbi:RICIN domain-containing protein [Streptomyces olivoreticuli]|uniref:RICIN domain-containing protein n=1 Tax=Streptomyces olivoreticuli TaxID=68246 RepID=UPI000E23691F
MDPMTSRTLRSALAIGASAAVLICSAATAPASASQSPSYVRLQVEYSGKCLTVEKGSMRSYAEVIQSTCEDGLDNQLFELIPSGSALFRIRAKHSGSCIYGTAQRWCVDDGDDESKWRVILVDVTKDLYELRFTTWFDRDADQCLTIDPNALNSDGAHTLVQRCIQHPMQHWRLQSVDS